MSKRIIKSACPSCGAVLQFSEELDGKNAACTMCGNVFTVTAASKQKSLPPLGRIALFHGIITREQLDRALEVQEKGREMGKAFALDDILLKLGFISFDMLNKLFAATVRALGKEFADIAFSKGFVSRKTLDRALETQAEEFKKSRLIQVGDLLLESGDITKAQYDLIMFGYQDRSDFQDIFWKRTRKAPSPLPPGPQPAIKGESIVKCDLPRERPLDESVAVMEENGSRTGDSIEAILESKKIITQEKVDKLVLDAQRKLDMIFCDIALKKGFISEEQAKDALKKQEQSYKEIKPRFIGEILISEGVLSPSRCNEILKFQGRGDLLPKASETQDKPSVKTGAPPSETAWKESSLDKDTLLGRLAVEHNFLSRENFNRLADEMRRKKEKGEEVGFEQLLLEQDLIPRRRMSILHLERIFLEAREKHKHFTRIAVEHNFIRQVDADAVLQKQMDAFKSERTTLDIPRLLLSDKKISGEQTATVITAMEQRDTTAITPPTTETEPSFPDIAVMLDRLAAFLILPATLPDDFTLKDLKALIKEQGIIYGIIKDDELEALLRDSAGSGGRFEIASGIPPRQGIDADITYHFNREYLKAGTVSPDGLIDFQDRGEIPQVGEGDLLAEKTPMLPGKNGKDVYGNIITVPETRDLKLSAGKGARLSEDRLKLYAEVDGTPNASVDGKISVFKEYHVKGDVCLKTGHVRFDGNVTVTGAVQPDFEVRGNHITAHEVNGARIFAKGDVNVSSGIIDSRISAGGNVRAKFVSNSIVEAFGNLEVQREILDSKASISGACINAKGEIISSQIAARKGFEAVQVGTDVSAPCTLRPGAEDHITKQLDELHLETLEKTEALTETASRLSEMESQQVTFHKNIADLTLAMERLEEKSTELKERISKLKEKGDRQRLNETVVEYKRASHSILRANSGLEVLFKRQDILQEKISGAAELHRNLEKETGNLETRRAELVEWAQKQAIFPRINVTGTIVEQTVIEGPNSKIRLENNYRKVMIKESRLETGEYKIQIHEL